MQQRFNASIMASSVLQLDRAQLLSFTRLVTVHILS
jgi:hypothetical protein